MNPSRDFWFISSSSTPGKNPEAGDLRLIYPNRYGAVNTTKIIRNLSDYETLQAEVTTENIPELLIASNDLNR